MEHIISDIKNIKTSLYQVSNYTLNKKVKKDKINNFEDLKGIGKEAWNFISTIYNVGWDVLITNSNSISFRNKVAAKFTLKITPSNASKNNNIRNVDKPASINKLSPFILAKMSKEINDIAKYFKKSNQSKEKMKSYTQATNLLTNNTREVLKIKGDSKPRPRINMTTKGPLRKQIIVLMNNDNSSKFLADLSAHISNIKRALKNIKLDIKADFV